MHAFALFASADADADRRVRSMLGALVRPSALAAAVWAGAEGRVALGARSSRLPEGPAVHAPTASAAVGAVRLDEPDAVRRAVGAAGDASDLALVLLAYLRWGASCVDHLDGDFAVAVWDGRAGRVFAARDRFGIKPLVYSALGGTLRVGPQPQAVLADPDVPRDPDLWRVAELITGTVVDGEATAFAAVRRLRPGDALVWQDGRAEVSTHWRPAPGPRLRLGLPEAAGAFRERFDRSVARRAALPGRVGANLSGGLDSSSVVTTLRALAPDAPPLPTFTAVYPGLSRADERAYSEAVEALGGVEPHLITPTTASPVGEDEADALGIAEPLFVGTWSMERALLGAARAAGVDVLLGGHGGDHVMDSGPHGYFADLLVGGRWARLARETRAHGAGGWRIALADVARRVQPAAVRRLRQPPPPAILDPAFARRVGYDDRVAALGDVAPTARGYHAGLLHAPLTHGGLDLMNAVSAALGVGVQAPFWDRGVVDLVLSLPRDVFYRDGVDRLLLREAMRGRLPDPVRTRTTKAVFGQLLSRTLSDHAANRVRRMLEAPGPLADWVAMDELGRRAARFESASGRATSPSDDADALVVLRCLSLWGWVRRTGL